MLITIIEIGPNGLTATTIGKQPHLSFAISSDTIRVADRKENGKHTLSTNLVNVIVRGIDTNYVYVDFISPIDAQAAIRKFTKMIERHQSPATFIREVRKQSDDRDGLPNLTIKMLMDRTSVIMEPYIVDEVCALLDRRSFQFMKVFGPSSDLDDFRLVNEGYSFIEVYNNGPLKMRVCVDFINMQYYITSEYC